jgi:hypothetical protein
MRTLETREAANLLNVSAHALAPSPAEAEREVRELLPAGALHSARMSVQRRQPA